MILSELAVEAVKLLTPFMASGAKKLVTAAGEVALDRLDSFVTRLKQRWSGNPAAENTLERFEKNPERYAPMMEDVLREEMQQDDAFAQEVAGVVNEVGPMLNVVQTLEDGTDVTGVKAGKVRGGATIDVEQDIKKGQRIIGADIDEIS